MTYQNFIKLPAEQMIELVMIKGCYITWRRLGEYTIELYALDNFFVEVGFSSAESQIQDDFLVFANVFNGTKGLDPYLEDNKSFELIKALQR